MVLFLFMKIFYPILFFLSLNVFGQNRFIDQKKDSIIYYLEYAQDSLEFPHLKRAILLSGEIQNDSLLRVSKIQYANAGYFRGDSIEKVKSLDELKAFYHEKKDSFALAKILHIKAMSFKRQIKLDSSFYYYQESKTISAVLGDSIQVGRRLLSMGLMQKNENDLVGAEATLTEGLRYIEPLGEERFTASFYNNLGLILNRFERYEEARDYFKKSFDKHLKNKHINSKERGFLDYFNNVGFSYIGEGNYIEAKKILEKGLELKTKGNHEDAYHAMLGNLADCLYGLGEKKEAWDKYYLLLTKRNKSGNIYGQSLSHNGLAELYIRENNNKKALFHAKKGYKLAKKTNNNSTRLSALLKLGRLTYGDPSKEYYQEYARLSDSLNNKERYYKDQFANIRYETEKKDKDNARLNLIKEQNEREIESQKQQKIIFSLAGALALVITITYFVNRRKKMMYEAQLQKASVREEERQQIAKSLHDEVAGDLRMLHQKLAKSQLETEAKSVETIKENVRNLSHQLSSVSFDEVSFKDQIINLISDVFSLDFRVNAEGINDIPWEQINDSIKRTIYICIRESLQNTIKYAEASTFLISFSLEKKEILVNLADNGKGFKEGKQKKGIGLKNLKERVEEIGGSFSVESSKEGTRTSISIPHNGK